MSTTPGITPVAVDILSSAPRRPSRPQSTLSPDRRAASSPALRAASWSVQAGVPAKVIANLTGHTSTRMVDLVYGRVGPSDYEAAVARLPGGNQSHAGHTFDVKNGGTHGTAGNAIAEAAIVNSVEESFSSTGFEVPRVGIEPTTRGFSVPRTAAVFEVPYLEDPGVSRPRLRLVR